MKYLPLFLLAGCFNLKTLDGNAPPQNLVSDWRDEVVYQVMVDRFANGDLTNDYNVDLTNQESYHGGDWQGVIDHLDYLQQLGVTTVWISPVVKNVESDAGNSSYHGYWGQDFTQVNPHFGTLAELRALSDALHKRKMKIVLDIVTNHVGQLFFYDMNKNGAPDILIQGSGGLCTATGSCASNACDSGQVCDPASKLCTPGGVQGSDPGASCLANGDCKSGQCESNLKQVTEYDPDYKSGGIRASTAAGDAGPAPAIFFNQPAINRVPPMPVALQSPDAYHKRGRVTDWNNAEQVQYGDFPGGLKDLATETPAVRQAMIDVYTRWADLIDFDGFRIDTVKHVEHEFWNVFCSAVRQNEVTRGKQNFIMFGEVFDGDDAKVGAYTRNSELDTTVNFPMKYQVFEDIVKTNLQPTSKFQTFWEARAANYAAQPALNGPSLAAINVPFNFLDNHDVPRYVSNAPSQATLEQALFLLLTVPGVPMIYYGTEQGFTGANDPSNREDMWTSAYNQKHPLYLWVQKLTTLRQEHEPLRRGSLEFRWTSARQGTGEDIGIIAFTRTTAAGAVLVVLNTSDGGTSSTSFNGDAMQPGFPANTVLVDAIGGQTYTVDNGGRLQLTLAARQNMLLVPK